MTLERAVVAFGGPADEVAVVWCTKGVMEDMTEGMYGGADVFEHSHGDNPDHGLWVWEGHIQIVRFDNPDTGTDYDVEYNGSWREPTDAEWAAIRKNENPWPDESKSTDVSIESDGDVS